MLPNLTCTAFSSTDTTTPNHYQQYYYAQNTTPPVITQIHNTTVPDHLHSIQIAKHTTFHRRFTQIKDISTHISTFRPPTWNRVLIRNSFPGDQSEQGRPLQTVVKTSQFFSNISTIRQCQTSTLQQTGQESFTELTNINFGYLLCCQVIEKVSFSKQPLQTSSVCYWRQWQKFSQIVCHCISVQSPPITTLLHPLERVFCQLSGIPNRL